MAQLTESDKIIRARKFDLIRSKTEAKKLAETIKEGKEKVDSSNLFVQSQLILANSGQIDDNVRLRYFQCYPS
jgi:hypothetical protein